MKQNLNPDIEYFNISRKTAENIIFDDEITFENGFPNFYIWSTDKLSDIILPEKLKKIPYNENLNLNLYLTFNDKDNILLDATWYENENHIEKTFKIAPESEGYEILLKKMDEYCIKLNDWHIYDFKDLKNLEKLNEAEFSDYLIPKIKNNFPAGEVKAIINWYENTERPLYKNDKNKFFIYFKNQDDILKDENTSITKITASGIIDNAIDELDVNDEETEKEFDLLSSARDSLISYENKTELDMKYNPVSPEQLVKFINQNDIDYFNENIARDCIETYQNQNIPLVADELGNIYQRETSANLKTDTEDDLTLLSPSGLIDFYREELERLSMQKSEKWYAEHSHILNSIRELEDKLIAIEDKENIKEYLYNNFTEETAEHILNHDVNKFNDYNIDITKISIKELSQKSLEWLDDYFNSLDAGVSVHEVHLQYGNIYKELAETAVTGINKIKEWFDSLSEADIAEKKIEENNRREPEDISGKYVTLNLKNLYEKYAVPSALKIKNNGTYNSNPIDKSAEGNFITKIKSETGESYELNVMKFEKVKTAGKENLKVKTVDFNIKENETLFIAEHINNEYKLISKDENTQKFKGTFSLSEEDFKLATGKINLKQIKKETTRNQIYDFLVAMNYRKNDFDFDIIQSKHDVNTIAAIDFIYELSKENLSYYDDASTLSQAIANSMNESDMIVLAEDTGEMEPISSFARELLHNNSLQFAVRDFAAAISELEENKKVGLLNDSKDLIEKFCINEYDSAPTFENLKDIGLAFTTWEDPLTHEEYEIQASVDLLNCTFKTTLNDVVVDFVAFENLEQMNSDLLSNLDFDSLVYMGDKNIDKALYQEHEDYKKLLCDKAEEILNESFEDEIIINDAALYIPSDYGFDVDNKLHILLQINSDKREDSLFNVLNETPFTLPNGIEVDFNPITLKEHGTIGEYLEHLQEMYEKERYQKSHPETISEKEKQSQTTEQIINSFTEKLRESNNGYDTIPVFNVLIKARDVLKSFSDDEKKVIGKWLMDSGITSEDTMKEKLENVLNPKEKKNEQNRENKRSHEKPLHSR